MAFSLAPESIALTVLAAIFARFILEDDAEKWYWRTYFWTVILVNASFGVFGRFGFLFGVFGVAMAPYVYFFVFHKRQFTLRDLMLFVLIFASMGTQVASVKP